MLAPFTFLVPDSVPLPGGVRGGSFRSPTPRAATLQRSPLTHPTDSSLLSPASASRACKSASSPRLCALTAPAPYGCHSPLPANAWRNCALRCASSPVFPDKPDGPPVSRLVEHYPPANDAGAGRRFLDRAPDSAPGIPKT